MILLNQSSIKEISYLTLNRPEFRNAFNPEMLAMLDETMQNIEQNQDTKIVIVNANGKSFSAGLDLPAFVNKYNFIQSTETGFNKDLYQLIKNLQLIFLRIKKSKKIFIASVHKHVYGAALDLITFCDIRIAAQNAKFCIAETNLGIVADLGSLNNLPQLIGTSRTQYMALTGDIFSANECYNFGLVNKIVEDNELAKETFATAKKLAEKPLSTLQQLKLAMNNLGSKDLENGLEYLAHLNAEILPSSAFIKEYKDK